MAKTELLWLNSTYLDKKKIIQKVQFDRPGERSPE